MKQNKIVSFIIGLIVFLAGCAPAPAAQTPTLVLLSTATVAIATVPPAPTETLTPAPTAEVFAPMELGDLQHRNVTSDATDYLSGRVRAQEMKNIKPFPADTPDGTWAKIPRVDAYTPFYTGPIELASFCKLKGKVGDVSLDGLYAIGYHIKMNGHDRVIHVVYDQKTLQWALDGNKISSGSIGIDNYMIPDVKSNLEKNGHGWAVPLIELNLKNGLKDQTDQLLSNDSSFPQALETELLSGFIYRK